MNSAPDPSNLFPDFSPVPQMVFVNERVSFQTEETSASFLSMASSTLTTPGRIAPPKPMPWFRCTNPDTPIRTIWHARSVTPREPCAASKSARIRED